MVYELYNCSFFRFMDLKKMMALSSIIHLNIMLITNQSLSMIAMLTLKLILLSHSLSSVGLFSLIGSMSNKTYSRYIYIFYFINIIINLLLFLLLLINLNFPGSINFISELLAIITIISIIFFIMPMILLFSFLESFIWFINYNKKMPFHSGFSLYLIHLYISLSIILVSYLLGLFVLMF